jgi:hypothetical protein
MFEAHLTVWAFDLALPKAGNSIAARIAMMAITTSNSINVKPAERRSPGVAFREFDGSSFKFEIERAVGGFNDSLRIGLDTWVNHPG